MLAVFVGTGALLGDKAPLAGRSVSGHEQPSLSYYVPEPPTYYVIASEGEREAAQCVVDQIERIRLDSGEKAPFRAVILSESEPAEAELVQQITMARRFSAPNAPPLVDLRGVNSCFPR